MLAKTEISASYRHVSTKILDELPKVLERVSHELGNQRDRFRSSLESRIDDPIKTFANFNRQFNLNQPQKDAVEWAWPQEAGNTMIHVINTYTKASQMIGLPAESSYRLQKLGGEVLGMLN